MASTIFDRDYTILTEQEQKAFQDEKEKEIVSHLGTITIRRSRYFEYPKAARHFESLFPGHFLDPADLAQKKSEFQEILNAFVDLLHNDQTGERAILDFVKKQKAYFIIGSLVKTGFSFGHHGLYIFPEFPLGTNFKADYLLVGRNSDGCHFLFVELEETKGHITKRNGEFGEVIRKGLTQVEDWEAWLEENFSHLRPIFEKATRPNGNALPREFTVYDSSRIHFAVIAGMRSDYKDLTRRRKRVLEKRFIRVMHYDNLVDEVKNTIGAHNY